MLTPASVVALAAKKDAISRSGFVWIPNTHLLLYSQVTNVQAGSWIYTIDADSGATSKLVEGESPVQSPDGKTMIFLRPASVTENHAANVTGAFELWIANSDGTNAHAISHEVRGICGQPAWSPNSQRVAYIGCSYHAQAAQAPATAPDKPTAVVYPIRQPQKSGFTYELRVISLSDNQDRLLLSYNGEFGQNVMWLDNNNLLYEHDNGHAIDMTLQSLLIGRNLTTNRERTMLSGYNIQVYYRPTLSADRTMVAFRGDAHPLVFYPPRTQIGILNLRTGSVRLLPFTKESVSSSMSWAPDNKWLVYSDGPSARLELVATNGIIHRSLTSGDGENKSAVFSSDGRLIAWIYDDGTGRTSLRVGNWRDAAITSSRTVTVLSDPFAGIDAGKTEAKRWKSFDGTTIDGYLTLPPNARHRRYPTVILIHGGPNFHNTVDETEWPGESYFIEYLAQQGYAVFQPDYRGSTAFGYDLSFGYRSRREPFKEDFEDISTGIAALERQGVIDPKRMYLIGHSYGSGLVNWAIAHDNRFRAAVSYEGFDLFFSWSGKAGPIEQYEFYMGNTTPLTDPVAWAANSAVLNAAHIRTPTLFINNEFGIYDGSMPWLAGALKSKGVPSQYVFYQGEPHILLKPANQQDLIERVLLWIRSH